MDKERRDAIDDILSETAKGHISVEEALSRVEVAMKFEMKEKLEFVAMKLDEARHTVELNMLNERPMMEVNKETEQAAKDWADNEKAKWEAVFKTLVDADGPFHGMEYVWQEYINWKLRHFDDDPSDEETIWYASVEDFLEGQLISD